MDRAAVSPFGYDVLASIATSITAGATLPVRDETVLRISTLLYAERLRRGTRTGRRALTWVDLWWPAKHANHGGAEVLTAQDGWPLWISTVRPGRDTTPPAYAPTPACSTTSPRSKSTARGIGGAEAASSSGRGTPSLAYAQGGSSTRYGCADREPVHPVTAIAHRRVEPVACLGVLTTTSASGRCTPAQPTRSLP